MSETAAVDKYLQELPAWQAKNLQAFRKLVHEVSPDVTEEIKWGVPVFMYKSKIVLAMASFKAHSKYNFFNGAQLDDPYGLFNSGLEAKKSRGIDLQVDQKLDQKHLRDLIHQAIEKA
jgi:hypothetical protein